MGNILSLEFLFDHHEMIGPFLIFCGLCLYAWRSCCSFKDDFEEMSEFFMKKIEVSCQTVEVTNRFFTNNPGIINEPIFQYHSEMITPFEKSCYMLSVPLMKLLLEHGADVNPLNRGCLIPFLICVSTILLDDIHDFSSLDVLLDAGCDINAAYAKTKMSALHMAAVYERMDLYDFLYSRGIDDELQDAYGKTAKMYIGRSTPQNTSKLEVAVSN